MVGFYFFIFLFFQVSILTAFWLCYKDVRIALLNTAYPPDLSVLSEIRCPVSLQMHLSVFKMGNKMRECERGAVWSDRPLFLIMHSRTQREEEEEEERNGSSGRRAGGQGPLETACPWVFHSHRPGFHRPAEVRRVSGVTLATGAGEGERESSAGLRQDGGCLSKKSQPW